MVVRFTPTCVGTTAPAIPGADFGPVHPHVRGDNGGLLARANINAGSPPRAWGQHTAARRRTVAGRFTPTCVGTTLGAGAARSWPTVHPHVRGDNLILIRLSSQTFGSPPRAWGQRRNRKPVRHGHRFTPTCVGTTSAPGPYPEPTSVHPHVRGDNAHCVTTCASRYGSPPRAWGQLLKFEVIKVILKNFPTCVETILLSD